MTDVIYCSYFGGSLKKVYIFLTYEEAYNFYAKAGRWSDQEIKMFIHAIPRREQGNFDISFQQIEQDYRLRYGYLPKEWNWNIGQYC